MKTIKSIITGSLVGVANIIPGLSGGTIAVILGIYQRMIEIISTLLPNLKNKNFKQIKEDIIFLFPIIIGMVLGIFLFSILLKFLLDNYIVATVFAFMGLIIGTIPMMIKNANKNGKPKALEFIPFLITLAIALILAYLKISNIENTSQLNFETISFSSVLVLMFFGIIAAGAMVIPGISGSLVLMLLGGYNLIITSISSLASSNFFHAVGILAPFGIGCVLGIFLFSALLNKLLKVNYTATYYGILGFIIGSIPCLYSGFAFNMEGYIAIALLIILSVASYFLTTIKKQ